MAESGGARVSKQQITGRRHVDSTNKKGARSLAELGKLLINETEYLHIVDARLDVEQADAGDVL